MHNLQDLKKAISENYVKLYNGSYIKSGDIITINAYIPKYFVAEYVKYNDKKILLFHSLFESFHFTLFNFLYVNEKFKYLHHNVSYLNLFNRSLHETNEELSSYLISKHKLLLFKTNSINLPKKDIAWFLHKRKGVIFRSNWNTEPTLCFENLKLYCNGILLQKQINTNQTGIYLLNNNHREYIWKQN